MTEEFINYLNERIEKGLLGTKLECICYAAGWFERYGSVPISVFDYILDLTF